MYIYAAISSDHGVLIQKLTALSISYLGSSKIHDIRSFVGIGRPLASDVMYIAAAIYAQVTTVELTDEMQSLD
jgi:hypothetical protein